MGAAAMPLIYASMAGAAVAGGIQYLGSKEQSKTAKDIAKKQQAGIAQQRADEQQRQLEAGEHWEDLNREQMELQSQMGQIKLLSDVITSKRQGAPRILQLPAAKTYTPAERMNAAIDDFLKRR